MGCSEWQKITLGHNTPQVGGKNCTASKGAATSSCADIFIHCVRVVFAVVSAIRYFNSNASTTGQGSR